MERRYNLYEQIAETVNDSARQVQRYIRLTYLIPELLKLVDEERIAFTPAVELSYLPENEQKILAEEIEYTDATPSLSQAQRLRKFSEQGKLSIDTIFAVLSEEKPNQKEQVKFKTEDMAEGKEFFFKNDVDFDGKLTAKDARFVLRMSAKLEKNNTFSKADNGSGIFWKESYFSAG